MANSVLITRLDQLVKTDMGERDIPVAAVGGNEIGMGKVTDHVKAHLLHALEHKALPPDTMVANGLIKTTHGIVDNTVDGFPRQSHIAVAELFRTIVSRAL